MEDIVRFLMAIWVLIVGVAVLIITVGHALKILGQIN